MDLVFDDGIKYTAPFAHVRKKVRITKLEIVSFLGHHS